jgi:hypothetical protein
MKNPTNLDSATESRASSTQLESTLMPSSHGLHAGLQSQLQPNLSNMGGAGTPGITNPYGESNYEVFVGATPFPFFAWSSIGLPSFPFGFLFFLALDPQTRRSGVLAADWTKGPVTLDAGWVGRFSILVCGRTGFRGAKLDLRDEAGEDCGRGWGHMGFSGFQTPQVGLAWPHRLSSRVVLIYT